MKLNDLMERLREFDLLLDTDSKFPSVTGMIAGDTGGGSWWAHPQAVHMYRLSCALRDHPDVLMVKLLSGKLTFIHRPLWPAVVVIGTAREPWQMDGLSKEAKALLKKTDRENKVDSSGDPARELEARLLAHTTSVHTEKGSHRKEVRSWAVWAASVDLGDVKLSPADARAQLESAVERINKQFGAEAILPWQTKPKHIPAQVRAGRAEVRARRKD